MTSSERVGWEGDIGWLRMCDNWQWDVNETRRAWLQSLVDQGYSPAEVGQIVGVNEARVRWILAGATSIASDEEG
jgi:hypothetical protein